jgi:hypothetical protein
MDAVKKVEAKEDDFLFDMLNEYLRDKKYKWVPELHNLKIEKGNDINWDLIKLNENLESLYKLELKNSLIQLILLNPDNNNNEFLDKLNSMHITDFKGIKNIEQLNFKLERDVHVMKCLVR